ncbi:MAG: hypothetical protein JJ863_32275 [Deltaproteobacteria bacterium]|nr:hypothetical protein [Deltaproteobacteria bacterium]
MRRLCLPAAILALVALAGCPARSARPASVVEAFGDALDDARYEDAYALLSAQYRRRVPFSEFRESLARNPSEVRELVGLLRHVDEADEVEAAVPLPDGDELTLVLVDGKWRIRGNVVDFYDQSSPRAALRSFVRAMERRRYDVVMRFVPEADREGMSPEQMQQAWEGENREEIERLIADLRSSLDEPIEIVGDRATMSYGDGAAVQFVREDGLWRIEDPD